MLIIQKINIIDVSSLILRRGRFFSLKKTVGHINNRNEIKHISHVGLCLFSDV